MLKKLILSVSAVAIIATSFSLTAKTPQSTSGKIAASILQTVNRHPGWSALLTALTSTMLIKAIATNPDKVDSQSLILWGWLGGWLLLDAGTTALMKNFDIEPLP